MIPVDAPYDKILQSVINIIQRETGNIDSIEKEIIKTPPALLLPTFSFLYEWIIDHDTSIYRPKNARLAFQLLCIINVNIPDILLILSGFDINSCIKRQCNVLYGVHGRVNALINHIREYLQPKSGNEVIYPFPASFDFKDDLWSLCEPDLSTELGCDNNYNERIYINHFKRMILNHFPIQAFKPFMEQKNKSDALTTALIEIIDELNNSKNATNQQLLVGFTYVFQYTYVFLTCAPDFSSIDVKKLCEHIQTMQTISPLCALAIVNHVPMTACIYNLLMPNTSDSKVQNYILFDKTNDGKTLQQCGIIQDCFSNFFNPSTVQKKEVESTEDFLRNDRFTMIDLIRYLQDYTIDFSKKCFYILNKLAEGKDIGIDNIFALGSDHMNKIITSMIRGQLVNCVKKNNIKETFIVFVKGVANQLCPTMSDKIGSFLVMNVNRSKEEDISLIILILTVTMMENILNSPNDIIIPFLINIASKQNPILSRFLIKRILLNDRPKIGQKIEEAIDNCNDVIILLDYASAILNDSMVRTCHRKEKRMELVEKIMSRLPFDFRPINESNRKLIISSVIQPYNLSDFNDDSNHLIECYAKSIRTNVQDDILMTQLLMYTTEMESNPLIYINLISKKLEEVLNEINEKIPHLNYTLNTVYTKNEMNYKGIVNSDIFLITLLQQCIQQAFYYGKMNNKVMQVMKLFERDEIILHWIYLFVYKFREEIYMNEGVTSLLSNIVVKYSRVSDNFSSVLAAFFSVGLERQVIYSFIKLLLESDMPLLQDEKCIQQEYHGVFIQNLTVVRSIIMLSKYNNIEIADMLAEPLYKFDYLWDDRTAAATMLGRMVAGLNDTIVTEFINIILYQREVNEFSLSCGRVVFAMCNIDVFVFQIFNAKVNELNINTFMKMVLPSFYRMYGNTKVSMHLVHSLLNAIPKSNKQMESLVTDIIGFICIKLGLGDNREEILKVMRMVGLDEQMYIKMEAVLDPKFIKENERNLFRSKRENK